MNRIYVASKTTHAPMWRMLRGAALPIISTWIDEADEGQTSDWTDLSRRCIEEAASADAIVLYVREGEQLKGALVECGAALACGVPVHHVGEINGITKVITKHPLFRTFASLHDAFDAAGAGAGVVVPKGGAA